MKKSVFFLLVFLFGSAATFAQKYGEDSVKCMENLYIYYELAKKKQFLEAYDGWHYVYENCPRSSKNNFIYGPYIVESKVKEAEAAGNENDARSYKTMLMNVYDDRLKYFPGKEGYVKGRKAMDMAQHFPDSSKGAYDLFKEALEIGGPQQSAAFYNTYFITAARLLNDDVFELEDVFNAYNVVIEGIEVNTDALNRTINELTELRDSTDQVLTGKQKKQLAKAERELDRYQTVASNIEKILAPITTCNKLNLLYNEETFAAHKDDTLWLKRAVKMLQKERRNDEGEYEDCTDNPMYFKISERLYQMEPSATAARGMYIMSIKNKDYSKAASYIQEAIDLEVDPLKKATDYNRLAKAYLATGRLSSSKSAALKAARLKKDWGDPYITLAQVYAAADGVCGSDVFEKKAVYWAAIDKLQYARSIDPTVASRANRLISAYKQQLPDKTVIFQLNHKEGDTHRIGCWIQETITVEY